jgi:hypothetical protein
MEYSWPMGHGLEARPKHGTIVLNGRVGSKV